MKKIIMAAIAVALSAITTFFVMKIGVITVVGVTGGALAAVLGGWDTSLQTLVIFMIVDYLSGFIVGAVFSNSQSTGTGALNSTFGFKGLCRKGLVLLIVLVAAQLDKIINTEFIRSTVVIGFVANETISIIENAGLMGVPIPKVIVRAVDVLQKKGEYDGSPAANDKPDEPTLPTAQKNNTNNDNINPNTMEAK
jgi:toxin secretion/phage lysis holin